MSIMSAVQSCLTFFMSSSTLSGERFFVGIAYVHGTVTVARRGANFAEVGQCDQAEDSAKNTAHHAMAPIPVIIGLGN